MGTILFIIASSALSAFVTYSYTKMRRIHLKNAFNEYYSIKEKECKMYAEKIKHLEELVQSSNQLLKVKSDKIQKLNEK
jgi:hypothetical protein